MSETTTNDKEIKFVLQENKPESFLSKLEHIFKIFSYITVPLLIAYGGWSIQKSISESEVNQQYVSLAISILSDKKIDEDDTVMRGWAVDILAKHSPVVISDLDKRALRDGTKVINSAIFMSALNRSDIELGDMRIK